MQNCRNMTETIQVVVSKYWISSIVKPQKSAFLINASVASNVYFGVKISFFALKNDQKLDLKNRIALRSQIFPHLSPFTMCADSLSQGLLLESSPIESGSSSTYPISVKGRTGVSLYQSNFSCTNFMSWEIPSRINRTVYLLDFFVCCCMSSPSSFSRPFFESFAIEPTDLLMKWLSQFDHCNGLQWPLLTIVIT